MKGKIGMSSLVEELQRDAEKVKQGRQSQEETCGESQWAWGRPGGEEKDIGLAGAVLSAG